MSVDYIQVRDLVEGDVFSQDDGETWQTVVATSPAGYGSVQLTVVYTDDGMVDLGSDDYVYVR